jgi:hypothetical protein
LFRIRMQLWSAWCAEMMADSGALPSALVGHGEPGETGSFMRQPRGGAYCAYCPSRAHLERSGTK